MYKKQKTFKMLQALHKSKVLAYTMKYETSFYLEFA